MNERVKAILLAALRLPPEERRALASALAENLDIGHEEAERLFGSAEAETPEGKSPLPATDTLSKYLDT